MSGYVVQDGKREYGISQVATLMLRIREGEISDYVAIAFDGDHFEVATSITPGPGLIHRLRVLADLLEAQR